MIQIVSKSIPNRKQIEIGITEGFKSIELQLFDNNLCKDAEAILKQLQDENGEKLENLDIYAVHSHILGYKEINIEDLLPSIYNNYFMISLSITEKLAVYFGHPINLVVHTGTSLKYLKQFPFLWDMLVRNIKVALESHPHVTLGVENTITFHKPKIIDNITPYVMEGGFYENVEIVAKLREELPEFRNRIFTILDTCHALTCIRYYDRIKDVYNDCIPITIEDYFKMNAPYCHHLHFSNVRDFGLLEGQHGCGFFSEDIPLLKELCNIYTTYMPDVPSVLEIISDDYENKPNWQKLMTMDNMKKLNIPYTII